MTKQSRKYLKKRRRINRINKQIDSFRKHPKFKNANYTTTRKAVGEWNRFRRLIKGKRNDGQ